MKGSGTERDAMQCQRRDEKELCLLGATSFVAAPTESSAGGKLSII